jgi:peptidoglycan hydrolase-like protein with peptidoglycan-binding domain
MALKKGSSGSEVVNLHRMLMELGAMPTGAASDRFGEATEQAVKKLQKSLGIKDDGIVGRGTLSAIARNKVLKRGDRGPAVRALQLAIGVAADGDYGGQTEARVELVQDAAGLRPPDGIVGPQTWRAIQGQQASAGAGSGQTGRQPATVTPAPSGVSGGTGITLAQAEQAVNNRSNLQLSRNFTLNQMIYSQTAARNGMDNWPKDPTLVMRLSGLCVNMLEPLQTRFGKITVNSGYRNRRVNRAVGSKSDNSNHVLGYAADIEIPGQDNSQLWTWIKNNMRYHELILEFYKRNEGPTSGWVHVAYAYDKPNAMRAFTIG